MVRLAGPAMSLDASGSLGGVLVFSKWKGRPYLRELVRPSNPRSGGQTGNRAMFGYLGSFWASLSAAEQATWETLGDQLIASPFNGYMSRNQRRWNNFLAPGQSDPIGESDAVGALPTTSATAGVRSVSVSVEVATLNQNWGVIVFRSLSTGFATALSNAVHVMTVEAAATPSIFFDSPLAAATYFYNYRLFSVDGVLGAELGEDSAVVT